MSQVKSGDYVNVGQEVGNAEEFIALDRTVFIQEEKLIAASPGIVRIDGASRTIHIQNLTTETRRLPKKGDTIIGVVTNIRKNSVGVDLYKVNDNLAAGMGMVGNIHVAAVSKKYIPTLDDAFQRSDIIRAKVLGELSGEFILSTNLTNLGVIRSDCKYCGTVMVRKNRDQIICPFCENVERRVLAPDYGMVTEVIRHV